MSTSAAPRRKDWHESKQLRKRAAFLLEDPDLIPTDVFFRIQLQNGEAEEVYGHKLFFGLASPVFWGLFYGKLKKDNTDNIDIDDVTVQGLEGLKRYIYTDSFTSITVDNVIDVLVASKKYLIAKLSRFCYGFIQNHITVENCLFLWSQAQHAMDDIVTEQCMAEIRRSTTKAILTEDFLDLDEGQVVELTSWDSLSVDEADLYRAVKSWRDHQEKITGTPMVLSKRTDSVFQKIRFTLLSPQQLVEDSDIDNIFSSEDFRDLYLHTFKGKMLQTFNPNSRIPVLSSFQLSFRYFSASIGADHNLEWLPVDVVKAVIWSDVAPKATQLLRRYVTEHRPFSVGQTTLWRDTKGVNVVLSPRKKTDATTDGAVSDEEKVIEMESKAWLWPAPSMICMGVGKDGLQLVILNETPRCDKMSGRHLVRIELTITFRPTESPAERSDAVVIGRALSQPPAHTPGLVFVCSVDPES